MWSICRCGRAAGWPSARAYDATRIAVRFGGGGHKGAAGGTLRMTMEEAVKAVEDVMTELCQ